MRSAGTMHLYRMNGETLRRLNRELFTPEQVASIADNVAGESWERKVLNTYFEDGKLTKIPDTRKKRDVILNWLVTQFEEGSRYTEAQVNAIIKRYHADSATLRRELDRQQADAARERRLLARDGPRAAAMTNAFFNRRPESNEIINEGT